MKTNPHWPDLCNHGPGAFVGTVDYYRTVDTRVIADVYLYQDDYEGLSVCARTGGDGHDYAGIGSIWNLVSESIFYKKIRNLLSENVNLNFEIKT